MSRAASIDKIAAVHSKLAEVFEEALDNIDPNEKGAAALLNVIRQFVKDNDVSAVAAPGSPMGRVADKMTQYPFDPAQDGRLN
ncbi:hypothetical protein ACUDTL_16875 [Stenotrophomonas pavanii]|uniref:hypothetical protein n=1 Tax=Stenotrophomonas pavanii TaxID=487698 RepID=UPI004041B7D2